MVVSRRNLSLSSFAALIGCAPKGDLTPAQIVADMTGMVTTLTQIKMALVEAKLLSGEQIMSLDAALEASRRLLERLSDTSTAVEGATVAKQVEGYLQLSLNILVSVPSPYSDELKAAAIILPIIMVFVNRYLPNVATARPTPAVATLKATTTMTPNQARQKLRIAPAQQ